MAQGINIEEIASGIQGQLADIQKVHDERVEEMKKVGTDVAELKSAQLQMASDIEQKVTAMERLTARVAQSTPQAVGEQEYVNKFNDNLLAMNKACQREHKDFSDEEVKDYASAFKKYVSRGLSSLTTEEVKALNTATDTQGGYLVVPEVSPTLINKQFDAYGILEAVGKKTTSGRHEEILDFADYDEGFFSNEKVEGATVNTTEKYAKITFANEVIKYGKKFSRVALEDAFLNIQSDVFTKMQAGMVRKLGGLVTVGEGNSEPRGLLKYPAGTNFGQIEQVESGTSQALKFTDLISLLPASLKDAYHANAVYAMKRATFFGLLAETDSTGRLQIQFMVNLFGGNGVTKNILGYDVKTDASMPAVAAGALAVAFGDLAQAYLLTTTPTVGVVRDETHPDFILNWLRERHDGKIVNHEAVKLLKIKA